MAGKTSKKPAKVAKKAAVKSSDDLSASKRIDKKIADLADWIVERLAAIRKLIGEGIVAPVIRGELICHGRFLQTGGRSDNVIVVWDGPGLAATSADLRMIALIAASRKRFSL